MLQQFVRRAVRRSSCRKQGVEADGRSCVRVHRVLGVRTHHPPNRRSPTARAHERSRAAAGTAAQPRRAGVAACTLQLEARTGGRLARTRKMAHDDRVRGRSRCFYSRYRDGADAQTGCASRELELTRFRLPRTFRCTSRPATINVGLSEAAPGQPERVRRARFASPGWPVHRIWTLWSSVGSLVCVDAAVRGCNHANTKIAKVVHGPGRMRHCDTL